MPRELAGALGDGLLPLLARHRLVDEPPLHGLLAAEAFGLRGEVVREITPHVPLVDDARESARPGKHGEQRQLRQRHRRAAIVDQHDVVAGEGELVTAARRRSVHRSEVALSGVRGGVLDAVARLVGELAEVHLPGVRARGEHADVRARAEDLVLGRRQHDRAHFRVLEPQTLHGVVQLDVDAEVVGVQFQFVTVDQPAGLVDVHGQRRDRSVGRQLPVPVPARGGAELDTFGHTSLSTIS
jgi:hypothetical protein